MWVSLYNVGFSFRDNDSLLPNFGAQIIALLSVLLFEVLLSRV